MSDFSVYVTRDEIARAAGLLVAKADRVAPGSAGHGYAQAHRRCALFLRFLWVTGCRVSEALGVDAACLNADLGAVKLRTLKKKRETWRSLPLPGTIMSALTALGPGRLFPWSRPHAYVLVRNALEAAGVETPRAHPHAIRHGHGVHAAKSNVPLPVIQRVMGHASLATTTVYLEVTGKDVERAYASVDW